ncbi:MAG: protein-tyrosine phosphatase family protein [Marivita sp.]|uniref:protein-tyrosine phosphatase family protein n=1 Tax=Marivita sp. TaxID=2003365 RepID=UPI003EF88D57
MILYAVPVGAGILAISPIPGADGAYSGDVQHLIEWKPSIVLSLVTAAELAEAGAAGLGQSLVDAGTRWEHMPIPDFGVPDGAFEVAWPYISAMARRAFMGGGRILVHCRGGCGRSGMVALRLMIESGEAPDDALDRLRAIRPCAVETDDQMRWALKARRAPAVFLRHGND